MESSQEILALAGRLRHSMFADPRKETILIHTTGFISKIHKHFLDFIICLVKLVGIEIEKRKHCDSGGALIAI